MAGDTVRLYTRQNDKTLLMLEHGGRILNQRVYVQLHFGDMAKHYLDCYDWFAREAAKLVPKPDYAELPIWCAVEAGRCLPPRTRHRSIRGGYPEGKSDILRQRQVGLCFEPPLPARLAR